MVEKATMNEQAIIEQIMHRRRLTEPRVTSDQMTRFKAKLDEEIKRTGKLGQEYIDHLMEQLNTGEL